MSGAMRTWVGTSGFSYPAWKGGFYPEDLRATEMLAFYAERLTAVELNNTFYRMPSREAVAGWASRVPDGFRLVVKAPRRITHQAKLVDCEDTLAHLWQVLEPLGEKRGPILFQLPPFLRCDVERLARFTAALPREQPCAFEFRHASWDAPEVHAVLGQGNHAVCLSDADDPEPATAATADWGYLRLRRGDYDDRQLEQWAARIRAEPWREAYVFLKHEDDPKSPLTAVRLAALLRSP